MPAQLQALNEGPNIPIDKPILLLGRDMECDIRLDSRKISRRHCCLARVGIHLLVRDLGSTNGVRINGVRVVEGRLKSGDELTIGNFRYRINLEEADEHNLTGTDKPPSVEAFLESCEPPIKLPKEDEEKKVRPRPASPLAAAPAPPAAVDPGEPPRVHAPTQVLPDELELAPASDDIKDLPKLQQGATLEARDGAQLEAEDKKTAEAEKPAPAEDAPDMEI